MFVRLLLASAVAVGLASAQGGGGGGGGTRGGGGMDSMTADTGGMNSGMPRAQRQSRADIVMDKLHLNKEQKEKAQAIFAAAAEEAGPINQQVTQGRNVITSAILDGKTGDEITSLMAQFTDLMVKRAAVEAKAYAKVYAILEPKQQAKAATVFAENMDGMFDNAGGRARGNRGGGR